MNNTFSVYHYCFYFTYFAIKLQVTVLRWCTCLFFCAPAIEYIWRSELSTAKYIYQYLR